MTHALSPSTQSLWERRPSESARAYEAFVAYRDSGAQRSLDAVVRQLGKSRTLISRWSAAHEWVARAEAYDAHRELQARRAREAEHLRELEQYRERQKRIAIATTERAIKLLQKAGAKLDTMSAEDITPKLLPAYFRAAAAVAEAGTSAEAQAIAVADLLTLLGDADGSGSVA